MTVPTRAKASKKKVDETPKRELTLEESIRIAKGKMAVPEGADVALTISPPNMRVIELKLRGTAPLVINNFGAKARAQMREAQMAGPSGKNKRKKEARNPLADFEDAKHYSTEGWEGFSAVAFRAAAISACRLVGFKMTVGKLSIFIPADGFDRDDNTPLVRIHGKSEMIESAVRNATGVADLRYRPMYKDWHVLLKVQFDADQFKLPDIVNLVSRVGSQIGIGEGRPDSKSSTGMGWGLFEIEAA